MAAAGRFAGDSYLDPILACGVDSDCFLSELEPVGGYFLPSAGQVERQVFSMVNSYRGSLSRSNTDKHTGWVVARHNERKCLTGRQLWTLNPGYSGSDTLRDSCCKDKELSHER